MTNFTPEQIAFINEVGDTQNSLRLDAVAGSGKTTTLLKAAQRLLPGTRAIALAFNKNIAEELAKKFPSNVVCKTLNSVGNAVWMKAHGRKNLDSKKMGDLVSKWCKANLEPEEQEIMWIQLRTVVTALKSGGFVPKPYAAQLKKEAPFITEEVIEVICDQNEIGMTKLLVAGAISIMQTSISEAFMERIDFDDQIYMSTYFADDNCWPTYDVVMVDEAQDLSRMQHDMVERLGGGSRLIVVGDERQAIYGWRGASCHSLKELQDRFGLKRMPLTVSFRCPEAVIKEAQKVVPHIQFFKTGGTVEHWHSDKEDEEERKVPGWFTDDFAEGSVVLCRNNAPLIRLGFALVSHGRAVFFANRDVGAGLKKIVEGLPMASAQTLRQQLEDWFDQEADKLRAKAKYQQLDALEDKFEALCAIAEGCKALTKSEITRGIDRLFLREPSDRAIELSTIHKSKGKEWQTVYLLNPHLIPGKWIQLMSDSGVPGSDDLMLQEENLRYVAITRALNNLTYVFMDKERDIYSQATWEAELLSFRIEEREANHG